MILLTHLILTTLATLFGWDVTRRVLPLILPGVVARVVIAVLAVVLWMLCPVSILGGMAVVGLLMMVGQFTAVEPQWEWGKSLADLLLHRKQQQPGTRSIMHKAVSNIPNSNLTSYQVRDKVGSRIPKL